MINDGQYKFLASLLNLLLWRGELRGIENIPPQGPAVFISNHLDATGPIAAISSIPVRLHSWAIGDMMDADLAPAWLQWDFTERQLHLKPPLSKWLAEALCRIVVPLFYSLGMIPVYRGDYLRMRRTYTLSMDLLRQGKYLLIFPEDNRLEINPETKMQPFQHSFVRLGELYYAESGKCLQFIPVTVHPARVIIIGEPVAFNPSNATGRERYRLNTLLQDTIIATYLRLSGLKTAPPADAKAA